MSVEKSIIPNLMGPQIKRLKIEVDAARENVLLYAQIDDNEVVLTLPPDQAITLGGQFLAKAGACFAQPDPETLKESEAPAKRRFRWPWTG